jgi:hypothetical protein
MGGKLQKGLRRTALPRLPAWLEEEGLSSLAAYFLKERLTWIVKKIRLQPVIII